MTTESADIQPQALKHFLDQAGMSASHLARTLHVSEATVNRWLKGKVSPSGTSYAVLITMMAFSQPADTKEGLGANLSPAIMEAVFSSYRLYKWLESSFDAESAASWRAILEEMTQRENKLAEIEKEKEIEEESLKHIRTNLGFLGRSGLAPLKRAHNSLVELGAFGAIAAIEGEYPDPEIRKERLPAHVLKAMEIVRTVQSQMNKIWDGTDRDREFWRQYWFLSAENLKAGLKGSKSIEVWVEGIANTLKEATRMSARLEKRRGAGRRGETEMQVVSNEKTEGQVPETERKPDPVTGGMSPVV